MVKRSVIALLLVYILFPLGARISHGEENCYELGYRFGVCATQSMQGIPCKPENDFALPVRCRGKDDTRRGIKAGVKAVYDTLNLDTGGSSGSSRLAPSRNYTQNSDVTFTQKEQAMLDRAIERLRKRSKGSPK